MCSHDRDWEYARVYVNGQECWSLSITLSWGSHQCGHQGAGNNWKEDKWHIQCGTVSVDDELIVRVNTTLNQANTDASFGISNVAVTRLSTYMNACMPKNKHAHTRRCPGS